MACGATPHNAVWDRVRNMNKKNLLAMIPVFWTRMEFESLSGLSDPHDKFDRRDDVRPGGFLENN